MAEDEYLMPINRPENLLRLKPGEEHSSTYNLRKYLVALPAGSYTLQVIRQSRGISKPGEKGWVVNMGAASLPCRFIVE